METSRDAEVKVCDCKRDKLRVRFPLEEIKFNIFFSSL